MRDAKRADSVVISKKISGIYCLEVNNCSKCLQFVYRRGSSETEPNYTV